MPQNSGPSFISEFDEAFIFSEQQPPFCWSFGGALYVYQYQLNSGSPSGLDGSGVYKSTDSGTTWTALDAANAPNSSTGAAYFDAATSKLVVALVPPDFTPDPIYLKNFDLVTETWGADYAFGGPNAVNLVQSVFKRPDGTIFVIYDPGTPWPVGTTSLRGTYWNGAAWSASIDLGVALLPSDPTGLIIVSGTCSAMDSTGIIHLAWQNSTRAVIWYQQFLPTNVLGPSHSFAGLGIDTGVPFGNLIVHQNSVLISFSADGFVNNGVLVGTPLALPVWSTVKPAVLSSPSGHINVPGPLASDGTNLLWMVSFVDSTWIYPFFKLAKSTDGGLTWAILPDNVAAPYFYYLKAGQSPVDPDADTMRGVAIMMLALMAGAAPPLVVSCNAPPVGITGNAYFHIFTASGGGGGSATAYGFGNVGNNVTFVLSGYFFNSEPLGGGPPPVVTFSLAGGTFPPGLSLAANGAVTGAPLVAGTFLFQIQATDTFGNIGLVNCSITINRHGPAGIGGAGSLIGGSGGGGGVRCPGPLRQCCAPAQLVEWSRKHLAERDIAPSIGSKHVGKGASIPAPATTAQTLILQYQVPNGFRFQLEGILLAFDGTGWTPGDGNVVFSVTVNTPIGGAPQGIAFHSLGRVLTPLGSFDDGPWPIFPGEQSILESRDILRVLVVSNPLVIVPGPPNVFTAMLVGHQWPR